jgi:hypothetical protein
MQRDTILLYEPGRAAYDYDANPMVWYEGNPYPMTITITNTQFSYMHPVYGNVFLVKDIDLERECYKVTLAPHEAAKPERDIVDYIYKHNLVGIKSPFILLLELNAAQDRMRIYNGETKRIIFDLIKVSSDFYDKYIKFIETNEVPEDLIIPKELLEGWLRDIEISPLYSQDGKIRYKTAPGTSLYSLPDTGSPVIATFTERETLIPREPGLPDTINGITGRWVWCAADSGETGWYFSVYLESLYAPVSFAKETEGRSYRSEFNLRLRSRPDTGGTVLVTIPAGTRLKLLEMGKTETVDGMSAPWVKVLLEDGGEGWCFSGYLKEAGEEPEAPPAAAAAPETPPVGGTEKAAREGGGGIPYTALVGGGAAIAAAGIVILLVTRRKKKPPAP